MLVLLCALAVIAIHRIWHHEDIAAPFRAALPLDPVITLLFITPAVFSWLLIPHPAVLLGLAILAVYPVLRGAVWVYGKFDPPPPEAAVCVPCGAKKEVLAEMTATSENLRAWEKRVIVFGGTIAELLWLAKTWPKTVWVAAENTKAEAKIQMAPNLMFVPVVGEDKMTLNNLIQLILMGGNATILTMNDDITTPKWALILATIRSMPAVGWIHVTAAKASVLPAHHAVVAPGADLTTVVNATKPLGTP